MKYLHLVALILLAVGCTPGNKDKVTTTDSLTVGDSSAYANGQANFEIVEDSVSVKVGANEVLRFAFPNMQMSVENVVGSPDIDSTYKDTMLDNVGYYFSTQKGSCTYIDVQPDTVYAKNIADTRFTVSEGGVRGRAETHYYVYQFNRDNICYSFWIRMVDKSSFDSEVHYESYDKKPLVADFEKLLASIKK